MNFLRNSLSSKSPPIILFLHTRIYTLQHFVEPSSILTKSKNIANLYALRVPDFQFNVLTINKVSESARLFRSFRMKISSRINRVVYKIIVGGKEKGNTTGLDGWENSKVFSSEERFLPSRRNACSRMCSRILT